MIEYRLEGPVDVDYCYTLSLSNSVFEVDGIIYDPMKNTSWGFSLFNIKKDLVGEGSWSCAGGPCMSEEEYNEIGW